MTMLAPPDPTTRADPVWSLHWRGRTFHQQDLSGQHLAVLALIHGTDDWEMLDINPAAGPVRLMLMIAAFLVVEAGSEDPAVIARILDDVRRAGAEELMNAYRLD